MKRTKLISILFIVVCLLTVSLSVSATGLEENLSFTVEASASTVSSNDTLYITVSMDRNEGFKFAKLKLSYDTTQLTYVGLDSSNCQIVSTKTDKNGDAVKPSFTVAGTKKNTLAIGSMSDGLDDDPTIYYTSTGTLVVLEFKVAEGLADNTKINFGVYVADPEDITDPEKKYDYTVSCGSTTVTVGEAEDCVHSFQLIPAVAPTCTSKGKTEGVVCKLCGEYAAKPKDVDMLPHTEVAIDAIPSTCTEYGWTAGTKCSVCETVLVTPERETKLADHVSVEIPAVPGTCQTLGWSAGEKCSVCDTVLVEPKQDTTFAPHTEKIIPAVPGTCEEMGLTEGKICSVCETVLVPQEETELGEHVWEITPGKDATCTAAGLSEGKKCTLCEEEIVQTVIGALGHAAEVVPGYAATCTVNGLTDGEKCSRCGIEMTAQKEIPAVGHTLSDIPAVAPTCTEPGTTAGVWCTTCEEVTVKPAEVAALGHDYVTVIVAPTCTANGYSTHTCSRCEDSYTDAQTDMVDHTPVEIAGKEPTCTETGLTTGSKCSVCDTVLKEQEKLDMVEHKGQFVAGKHPTCTEDGYTESTKCAVCGLVMEQPGIRPATGHVEVDVIGYPATYEQAGLSDGKKCNVCGTWTVKQTTIAALKHTIEIIPGKAPTCTEPGLTEGQKCVGCCNGEIKVEQEEIPALGHDYKAVVTAPTCSTNGYTTYTCSRCEDSYTGDTTVMLPHTEIVVPGTAATCTATGLTDGTKCSECGLTLKAQEEIAMTAHTFGDWTVVKEATATEDGSKTRACTACAFAETEVIPALGVENPTEPGTQPTEPGTQPTEPETKPNETKPQPTNPGNNQQADNTDMVLIIAVIALFIAAAAIIVLLILKKK